MVVGPEETLIRDAIHGDIALDSSVMAILDTPALQRLRYVRQLATAYQVFPSAHHTRFEHSLGVYHLTRLMCDRLVEDEEKARHVAMAGLLHDIGHSAFSHLSEPVVKAACGKGHEELGIAKIMAQPLASDLERHGYSVSVLQKILSGKDKHSAIISGDLGTDRMDYLLRDAYFCGVQYSVIDAKRLISIIKYRGNDLVIPKKGIEAAESLLVSRNLMISSVYYHHAIRIGQEMLRKALSLSMLRGELTDKALINGTDDHLLYSLVDKGSYLALRLSQRKLFKRAVMHQFARDSKPSEWQRAARDIDAALSEKIGLENYVIAQPSIHSSEISFLAETDDGLAPLVEVSPIARALTLRNTEQTLIVACDNSRKDVVSKACAKFV